MLFFNYSGDQDSVIPLTGSRTLVHGLAEKLGLNKTVPYRVWFEGQQVNYVDITTIKLGFLSISFMQCKGFADIVNGRRVAQLCSFSSVHCRWVGGLRFMVMYFPLLRSEEHLMKLHSHSRRDRLRCLSHFWKAGHYQKLSDLLTTFSKGFSIENVSKCLIRWFVDHLEMQIAFACCVFVQAIEPGRNFVKISKEKIIRKICYGSVEASDVDTLP